MHLTEGETTIFEVVRVTGRGGTHVSKLALIFYERSGQATLLGLPCRAQGCRGRVWTST